MQIDGFTDTIIVPYLHREDPSLSSLLASLSEEKSLYEFLDTLQFEYLRPLDLSLSAEPKEVDPSLMGKASWLVLTIKTSKTLTEIQVSETVRRLMDWVNSLLTGKQVAELRDYVYSILSLSKTTPANITSDLKHNKRLLRLLVFVQVPPDLYFTDSAIEKLSAQSGYLKTDFYCFSPYGALIYDVDMARSQKYIDSQVIPRIANFRTMQAFLESLSADFNKKISEQSSIDVSGKAFEELALLRETSLRALSLIEYDQRLPHLAEISEKVSKMFGLAMLQASLEHKVEVLNSITQTLAELSARKLESRLSRANLYLGIISVVAAVLAAPAFALILKLLFGI